MNRAEMLQRLREPVDVLVIGGGASGLACTVDATTRGHRTALVEQADFTQATSSRSTKLIHGGVRYLQQGRLSLVREALRERGRLLHNAPHLVHPLPFVLPLYHWWERPFYGIGLKLYDWLAHRLAPGPSRHLNRDRILELVPTLARDGLRGGIVYQDGQFDDARLAITLAQTAVDHGAAIANYVKVISLLKQNDRVTGALVRDVESGDEFEVRARVVINATGVFSDDVRKLDDPSAPKRLAPSQGAHIVLDRSFLPGRHALIVPRTSDGRVFFAIPWHDHTLVGTTDTEISTVSLEPRPLQAEIEFLIEHATECLEKKPTTSDILSVFAGLRPLVKSSGKSTAHLSRSHEIVVSASGLVSIIGGKWTTARQMAEDTIDRAVGIGGLPAKPSRTKDLRLHGWREKNDGEFSAYGTDADAVAALCKHDQPLHPRLSYRAGQVRWAVRHEMARTVEDVLSRRLRALLLDAKAAEDMAPAVAKIIAEELGRDEAWQKQQTGDFQALAKQYLAQ